MAGRFMAAALILATARLATAQGEPPYEVALQADPNDSTSLTLTWRDGWWNGFVSAMPLDGTLIVGSTTPWDEDIDFWANTIAQPMDVDGPIPTPSLDSGSQPGQTPIGTQHTIKLVNLQDGATYYVAVRGVFGGGAMSVGPEGADSKAVPHDPGAPGDPVLSVHQAGEQSLVVQWVAPGDDASGPGQSAPAATYVVGLGWTAPPAGGIPAWIHDANSIRVTGSSDTPGQLQLATFGNLSPGSTYYVAVQVSDEGGHASVPAGYLTATTAVAATGSDSSGCPFSGASTRGLSLLAPALLAFLAVARRR